MKRGRLPHKLVMSPTDVAKVLTRLASTDAPGSQELYTRIMASWGSRPDRAFITFRPTSSERQVLRRIPLPAKVVQSTPRFVAVYRCDSKSDVEVVLRTPDRPPRKRKLKVAGGTRRFTLIKLYQTKESNTMAAKTKTAGKKKTPAKPKADPVDELEAELEGLEEVEIDDEDEPEVEDDELEEDDEESEDDEDDEETDYSSMTNAALKTLCKERGLKGIDKANKAKLVELLTASDNEDEEDEDEEDDDGLDELDRAGIKAKMKELGLPNAKKSQSDDDLRALVRSALTVEDDEEEDEEEDDEEEEVVDPLEGLSRSELKAYNNEHELGVRVLKSMSDDDLRAAIADAMTEDEDEAPAPKKAPAKKGTAKGKQPTQLVRKLPAGKLGANDIAEMAGTKALNVRNFLRNNKTKFPKNEELGRYAFTEKQARAIVAAMKKGGASTKK